MLKLEVQSHWLSLVQFKRSLSHSISTSKFDWENLFEWFKFGFSDQTTFKRGSTEDRFIPLTTNIGEITKIDLDFKKTGNIISSSWYSSTWSFTRATVLNADTQQRWESRSNWDVIIRWIVLVDHIVLHKPSLHRVRKFDLLLAKHSIVCFWLLFITSSFLLLWSVDSFEEKRLKVWIRIWHRNDSSSVKVKSIFIFKQFPLRCCRLND